MDGFRCNGCGSSQFYSEGGYRICTYCGARYGISDSQPTFTQKTASSDSGSSVSADVAVLLRKIEAEPWNAKRYANRILDIDPTNKEAKKYL